MTTTPHTPTDPPLPAWSDQSALLLDLAVADLESGHDVLPTMVAFRGDQPLLLTTLRPFERGQHHDAVIEVGALAMALSADRIILSLSGRAWSTDDPIPPVLPGHGDLRQQVIVLHAADASSDDPITLTTVVPVDVGTDEEGQPIIDVGPAMTDSGATGWVPQALLAMAADSQSEGWDAEDLGLQIRRCELLGHQIAWSPTVMAQVEQARLQGCTDHWAGEAAA
ncbi:hypothetical protein BH23ACT9_BH23ACT9_32210 [soil metagenome]